MTRRVARLGFVLAAPAAWAVGAACSGSPARPAPVELEWPDAAAGRIQSDAGAKGPGDTPRQGRR
jgi:hypothetical protein